MADGVARVLYGANGEPLKIIQDGSDWKLDVLSKLKNASNSIINPAKEDGNLATLTAKDFATETKLEAVRALLNSIDSKDFATQTTLAAFASMVASIDFSTDTRLEAVRALLATLDGHMDVNLSTRATETTLASIKDTDGVKKITDQLPAGTNEIGKVAQGTKAAGSGAWPQVLYDVDGHPVGVVLDGSIYRIQSDSKVAVEDETTDLTHLRTFPTTHALKATLVSAGGDIISFPSIATDPSGIVEGFVEQTGGTDHADLTVDGSTTPVDFSFNSLAEGEGDLAIQSIGFVMVANSIVSGSGKFAGLTKLTNGIQVISKEQTTYTTIGTLYENEDLMHFASSGGYNFWPLNKDQVQSIFFISGAIVLHAGHSDSVVIRISDDLSSGIDYLKCYIKAVKRGG